ncbi:MAG: DNA repair protein RecO [Dysgonomonas sp.]
MLHKLQGVVLSSINYNDKYLLVSVYTDASGRVTYMIPKSSSKTANVKRKMFSPLAVLDIEADHRNNRDIQRIKEARFVFPLLSIPENLAKTSMAFFLSEFLSKILREVNENKYLFDFLVSSVQVLEYADKSVANYHLVFMLKLTRFLGFSPNFEGYCEGNIFDMLNGVFVGNVPAHNHYLSRNDSMAFARLARINYENMHLFRFSRQDRINIINRILEYYRIHLTDFPPIKSLDVLHELF